MKRTRTMPRSGCRFCEPCIDVYALKKAYRCKIEEWDATTICRRGYCRHYRAPCKTHPATQVVTFPAEGEGKE